MVVPGAGSLPALLSLASLMQGNWFLGSLVAGLISSSIANLLLLLPKKGMVLMSAFVFTLSLVACEEFLKKMPV